MGGTCRGHNCCRHPAPCGMFLEGFVQGNAHCLAALSPQCTICPSLMGSFYRHVCTGITPPTMQEIRRGSNPPPRPKSWQSGDVNNVSDALIREWMPEHVSWQTCKHPPNTDIYIYMHTDSHACKNHLYIYRHLNTYVNKPHTHTYTHNDIFFVRIFPHETELVNAIHILSGTCSYVWTRVSTLMSDFFFRQVLICTNTPQR